MTTALANFQDMAPAKGNLKSKTLWISLAVVAIMFSALAMAAGTGTEFNAIYTTFDGWVKGVPGKTVALLAFFYALYNITQQNYQMAAGAFLGSVLCVNAGAILDLIFTASIPGLSL
ncbi:hypothetical protein [Pseudoalteromonas rubra]|uniref:Pili assembly chaperone n=1 Tax=Pseudoalteromonas rubra TaxID=43658 RepID=A0A0U3I845_9GAMM|nr:hypothetical protein [Pseudoalteromonas rubra]ALU46150.1 hypothetical protein AT705_24620 [Pseudoalteromonas rubra]